MVKIRDRKLYEEIYNEVCRILSAMQHYNGGVVIEAELTYEELENGWVYNSKYGKIKEVQ